MKFYVLLVLLLISCVSYWIFQKFHDQQTIAQHKIDEQNQYKLIPKTCWFSVDWKKTTKCFYLKTPLSTGEYFLPVVIFKDESIDHREDPVVYLQGGPGAGAGLSQEGIDRWQSWLTVAQLHRDLILIDPRGTGLSLPKLNCSDQGQQINIWKNDVSLSDELKTNYQSLLNCFRALEKENSSLSYLHLSTKQSATDVINLMARLPYQAWNILGVSYGTRQALEIEKQLISNPDSGLKALVLDSLYPAGLGGVQTWPEVLDSAMRGFFNECVKTIDCKRDVDNSIQLQADFLSALEKLKSRPVRLIIKRWDGEAPVDFVVNDHRFVSAVFAAIYNPHDWQNIANAINAINYSNAYESELKLKILFEPYLNRNLNSQFNSLAFTAVDCADNQMGSESDYLQSLNQYPLMADYTKDQWRYQLCHELPGNQYLNLTSPQHPILILSGKNDPVTPSAWADAMHRQWKGSQLIFRKNLAHSILSTDICLLENLHYFFDEPTREFSYCGQNK